jgi:hypothetical protein
MRIRVTAAMAAVLLCAASSGFALTVAPGTAHVVTYGAGAQSCGKWQEAESHDPALHAAQTNWVPG